ncbi:MAG: hypothetical protein ACM3X7_13860 [Solirubrobacterales bacterium]
MSSFNKIMITVIVVSFVFTAVLQFISIKRAKRDAEAARKRQYKNKPVNKRKK